MVLRHVPLFFMLAQTRRIGVRGGAVMTEEIDGGGCVIWGALVLAGVVLLGLLGLGIVGAVQLAMRWAAQP